MADLNSLLSALPSIPGLQGPRVRLRGPQAHDVPAIFALYSDPHVVRYRGSAPMTDPAQAQGRLAEMLEAFAQCDMIYWLIAERGDAVIGTCTLFHFDARHRSAEIGYALRSDRWGAGLAHEAATLAIDWAFRALALHRIDADIDPRNAASRKLLERLGFVSAGVSRQRFFLTARR